MLEIVVRRENGVISNEERKVPIPDPGENEVLIKVEATDSNPKDWKAASSSPSNQGDDISGVIAKVGAKVYEFKPGDRVSAFHRMFAESGSYAEYAIAPATTTFHLPPAVSFEAGATLPLASMTAALALYQHLGLPTPWNPVPKGKVFPVLIYGGSSAVGAYALKFAKLSNLNPIITVAGSGVEFVKSLGAADYIVDYRGGNVPTSIKKILDGRGLKLKHAFDAICEHDSWNHIIGVLDTADSVAAKLNMVDPPEPIPQWPAGIEFSRTFVSSAYGTAYAQRTPEEAEYDRDFAYIFYRYLTLLLAEGRFEAHPFEVQPNGLLDVGKGIQALYDRKVSSKKLVYRISDTPNLEAYQ